MKGSIAAAAGVIALFASAASVPTEISVSLKMDAGVYVMGERIRCEVSVENSSADSLDVGTRGSVDNLVLELFRASDREQFDKVSKTPFTAPFLLHSGEGQRLETFLGDHYPIKEESRYLARAVLVHGGYRYESTFKSFDVIPGMKLGSAMQLFAGKPGCERHFEVVFASRAQSEHAFLKVFDKVNGRVVNFWPTSDLGTILRVSPPKISIMPDGEVVILHRATQDNYVRTVFWSLPDAFEFQEHEAMLDPDVAGAARVRALYMESGEVDAVRKKKWWKFW